MHSYFSIGLVVIVVAAMAAIMLKKMKQRDQLPQRYEPRSGAIKTNEFGDDCIIAVRKRERERSHFSSSSPTQETSVVATPEVNVTASTVKTSTASNTTPTNQAAKLIVMYIMAKNNKQFAGYELLQALLTAGMRFGDMNIFHRYQDLSGSGSLLFSLASATEPGTFDIHDMGGFTGRGLTVFMQSSGNSAVDVERYELMLKTAQQLAEDLDGQLLDEKRQALTKDAIHVKKQGLGNPENCAAAV